MKYPNLHLPFWPLSAVVKDAHDCIQAFVFPFDLYVVTRNIDVGMDKSLPSISNLSSTITLSADIFESLIQVPLQ